MIQEPLELRERGLRPRSCGTYLEYLEGLPNTVAGYHRQDNGTVVFLLVPYAINLILQRLKK